MFSGHSPERLGAGGGPGREIVEFLSVCHALGPYNISLRSQGQNSSSP